VSRLLYEQFVNEYRATVEELHSGEYELNGMPVTLDILDTSGRLSGARRRHGWPVL
jgi:RASD family, member 2